MAHWKPWPTEQDKRILALVQEGKSDAAISREIGVHPSAISQRVRKMKLRANVEREALTLDLLEQWWQTYHEKEQDHMEEEQESMTEERATYDVGAPVVKAVRLENFAQADWQGFLSQRLFTRYPGARIVDRRTHVALIELRTSAAWSRDDDAFFASMKLEGYFQRWETVGELPPAPKRNQAIYEDIGYRIGNGEKLTPKQQEVLFSQLHSLEERATLAEREVFAQRDRANGLEEHTQRTIERHNQFAKLLSILEEETQLKISGDFPEGWTVEDVQSGRVVVRDAVLSDAYRSALRYMRMTTGGAK